MVDETVIKSFIDDAKKLSMEDLEFIQTKLEEILETVCFYPHFATIIGFDFEFNTEGDVNSLLNELSQLISQKIHN